MRKAIAFAALAGLLVAGNLPAAGSDDLFVRGRTAFRAGQYEQSIPDLSAAADSYLADALLDRYETSLVYLALAYERTNRDADALETIVRIAASERVEPRFARLELSPDVAAFPDLATRLASGQLPAHEDTSLPLPAVTAKVIPPPAPMPVPVANVNGSESLQQAEELAARGDVASAAAIYERFLATPGVSRETLVQVAAGFYRINVYDRARYAFDRVGELRRGEEDLRYYKAVSLFETGAYYDARKELDCALPFIEVTTDVAHYSAMIDEMAHVAGAPAAALE
jgi:tetratricopeptide (TPR) repeat protein